MRRKLAALLAVLMLAGCFAPALAEEGAAAPEDPVSLFTEFGPWGAWTGEQKAAAENWSDEAWGSYWEDYAESAWDLYNRYSNDYYTWQYESYDYESSWKEYLVQIKTGLGMPYPEGINVSVNGAYLDLGADAPIAVSGRTLVPFRAFLERLGASVSYSGGTITAVLADGEKLELHLDSTVLKHTAGEKIDSIDMGMTPYVSGGRTYIPVRFAAEALGYEVFWSDYYEVAYLTDYAALQAELDSHFHSFNAVLAAGWAALDPEMTYAGKERFSLSGTLYKENGSDTAKISLAGENLTTNGHMSGDYTLSVDLGGLRDTLFSVLPQESLALLDKLDGSGLSFILNREAGTWYVKSGSFSELGVNLPDDTWVGARATGGDVALLETMLPDRTGAAPTVGSNIVNSIRAGGYYYATSPWELAQQMSMSYRLVLDDENFTVTKSGSTASYTVDMDLQKLMARAAELDMLGGLSVTEVMLSGRSLPDFTCKLTATVRGEKLDGITAKGSVKMKGVFPVEVGFDLSGGAGGIEGTFAIKGTYLGKLEMKLETSAAESSRTVPDAPPSGEAVVDFGQAAGTRLAGVPEDFGAQAYVQAVLDAAYKGRYDPAYLKAAGMTAEEARAVYESNLETEAEYFFYMYDIDYPSQALRDEVIALYREIYGNLHYDVGSASPTEGGYGVGVTVEPYDLFARVDRAFYEDEAINAFWDKYEDTDVWNMTDEEYKAYDAEWAGLVMDLVRAEKAQAGNLEPVAVDMFLYRGVDGRLSLDLGGLNSFDFAALPYYDDTAMTP